MRLLLQKREAESIVEKLCQRFQAAPEPRQWRDIAFCLSLLPFNSEIAVKKLVEGLFVLSASEGLELIAPLSRATFLPRQASRGDGLQVLQGDFEQGASRGCCAR